MFYPIQFFHFAFFLFCFVFLPLIKWSVCILWGYYYYLLNDFIVFSHTKNCVFNHHDFLFFPQFLFYYNFISIIIIINSLTVFTFVLLQTYTTNLSFSHMIHCPQKSVDSLSRVDWCACLQPLATMEILELTQIWNGNRKGRKRIKQKRKEYREPLMNKLPAKPSYRGQTSIYTLCIANYSPYWQTTFSSYTCTLKLTAYV